MSGNEFFKTYMTHLNNIKEDIVKEFDKISTMIGEHHSQDCCSYWEKEKIPQFKSLLLSSLLRYEDAIVEMVEERNITYEKGREMCGCGPDETATIHPYACSFKKGYNLALSSLISAIKNKE